MNESDEVLRAKLNGETGKITWKELERHYARGVVLRVTPDLDLVDVALGMAKDDKAAFERWLTDGQVARATEVEAQEWGQRDPLFWAVVTAPWILVQEITETQSLH